MTCVISGKNLVEKTITRCYLALNLNFTYMLLLLVFHWWHGLLVACCMLPQTQLNDGFHSGLPFFFSSLARLSAWLDR